MKTTPHVENPYGRVFRREGGYTNPFVDASWPCFLVVELMPRAVAPYFDALRQVAPQVGDTHFYLAEEGDPNNVVALDWDSKAFLHARFERTPLGALMFGDSGRWGVVSTDEQFSFLGGDIATLGPVVAELGGPAKMRDEFESWIADQRKWEEISRDTAKQLHDLNQATRRFDDELTIP
jgi:hypothetical protein